ncbi:MAG TPA: glycosyltransferase family 39 protein [Kiritimatiellia bacterium]|nr:glycosyltransferase family 39 protein [Kiritimatiellia bacterium]
MTRFLVQTGLLAIRMFPFLVLLCVLVIPAFKGRYEGYVPVMIGGVAALVWLRWREPLIEGLGGKSFRWLIVVMLGIPALLQIALVFGVQPHPRFDGWFVYRHAEVLVETGRMDPFTYYPPAQTWWYGLWFTLFGSSFVVAQLSQIPLSLGVIWLTYRIGRDLGGEGVGRVAGLAVAWYPSFLLYVLTTPYYHYLYTLATLALVHVLFRGDGPDRARGWVWLVAGVWAGIGALTKAVQLIAPLQVLTFLVMWEMERSLRSQERAFGVVARSVLLRAGLVTAGLAVVLAPWVIRNYKVFDAFVPVCTSGGLVLLSANNPESNGLFSPTPDQVNLQTPAEMLTHSRWCSEQAKAFMREHPIAFLDLVWRKFLHTWGVEATFTELINVRGTFYPWLKDGLSVATLSGWSTLVVLWVVAAIHRIRRKEAGSAYEWLFGVLLLSNAVVYVIYEGGDRHHLPLVPLILIWIVLQNKAFRAHP